MAKKRACKGASFKSFFISLMIQNTFLDKIDVSKSPLACTTDQIAISFHVNGFIMMWHDLTLHLPALTLVIVWKAICSKYPGLASGSKWMYQLAKLNTWNQRTAIIAFKIQTCCQIPLLTGKTSEIKHFVGMPNFVVWNIIEIEPWIHIDKTAISTISTQRVLLKQRNKSILSLCIPCKHADQYLKLSNKQSQQIACFSWFL